MTPAPFTQEEAKKLIGEIDALIAFGASFERVGSLIWANWAQLKATLSRAEAAEERVRELEAEVAKLNGADPDYGDWFWPKDQTDVEHCSDHPHEVAGAWEVDRGEILAITRATLLPDVFVLGLGDNDYKTFATKEEAEAARTALQTSEKTA